MYIGICLIYSLVRAQYNIKKKTYVVEFTHADTRTHYTCILYVVCSTYSHYYFRINSYGRWAYEYKNNGIQLVLEKYKR